MSSPPTTRDRSPPASPAAATDAQDSNRDTLERIAPALAKPLRVAGFWAAIVLPFLHVPLLATGLSNSAETFAFLALLALNLLALYVGHSHRR